MMNFNKHFTKTTSPTTAGGSSINSYSSGHSSSSTTNTNDSSSGNTGNLTPNISAAMKLNLTPTTERRIITTLKSDFPNLSNENINFLPASQMIYEYTSSSESS